MLEASKIGLSLFDAFIGRVAANKTNHLLAYYFGGNISFVIGDIQYRPVRSEILVKYARYLFWNRRRMLDFIEDDQLVL